MHASLYVLNFLIKNLKLIIGLIFFSKNCLDNGIGDSFAMEMRQQQQQQQLRRPTRGATVSSLSMESDDGASSQGSSIDLEVS